MAEGPIEGTWIVFQTLEVVDARTEKYLRFPGMGISTTRRKVTDGSVIYELRNSEDGELGAIELSKYRNKRTEMVVKGPPLPHHRQPTPEEQVALGVPTERLEEQELYRRRTFHQWWVIAGLHELLRPEMRLVIKENYGDEDTVLMLSASLVEISNCINLTNQRMNLGLLVLERLNRTDRAVWGIGNSAVIAEKVGDKTTRVELALVKLTIPDALACYAWNSLGDLFVEAQWTRDFHHISFIDSRALSTPVLPDRATWIAATRERLRREVAGIPSEERLDEIAEELWTEHQGRKQREIERWQKAQELAALTTEDATHWYFDAMGITTEPNSVTAATVNGSHLAEMGLPFPTRLHIEDIDSFGKVKDVPSSAISHLLLESGYLNLPEDIIQKGLEEILVVTFHKKDWGGERNDLYTDNLIVRGRRIPTAFLLKGSGLKQRMLEIRDCGKNGDQLVRLFESPADLFIVQFVGEISEAVIKDVEGKANELRSRGKLAWYCIMNGQDTARLLHAYGKI